MSKRSITLTDAEQNLIKSALREQIRILRIKATTKDMYSPEWKALATIGELYKRFDRGSFIS